MSEEYVEENIAREQTQEATDKKCPACGGTVEFDPKSGGLSCPFCGSKYEIEAKKDDNEQTSAKEIDFNDAEARGNCDWGAKKKTIICKMCGAESIYDELDLSNECPYCGSNQVMEESDVDTLAPGGVCPFQVDKKNCGREIQDVDKGKAFLSERGKGKGKARILQGCLHTRVDV
jgi:DNA-directed RNA polymerase subunit RPC12/RpoP